MIYTITCNPSIDYFVEVDGPMMDTEVNRARNETFKAGGKGINVSMVLNELCVPSHAIALLGGFSGEFIKEYVRDKSYLTLVDIPIKGINRINVKMKNEEKTICVNGKGPFANEQTKEQLFASLRSLCETDWVIISGSFAQRMDVSWLIQMAAIIHDQHAKLIVDMESVSQDQLRQIRPYLIKPNLYELSLLAQKDIKDDAVLEELQKLQACGVENILLSMGKDGAIYMGKEGCYRLIHPEIHAVNKVGSGDAMLAAFIAKRSSHRDIAQSLKWGGAAAMAAVSTLEDVHADAIEAYLPVCHVEKIIV